MDAEAKFTDIRSQPQNYKRKERGRETYKVRRRRARITYNYLYENMPVDWREPDLLFVKLPNGNVIDVGWYPACDPAGLFKITLSDSDQNQIASIRTPELDQVAGMIEGLASDSRRNPARETSSMTCIDSRSTYTASCTAAPSPMEVNQPATLTAAA